MLTQALNDNKLRAHTNKQTNKQWLLETAQSTESLAAVVPALDSVISFKSGCKAAKKHDIMEAAAETQDNGLGLSSLHRMSQSHD